MCPNPSLMYLKLALPVPFNPHSSDTLSLLLHAPFSFNR